MKLGIVHISDLHFRAGEFNQTEESKIAQAIFSSIKTDLIGTTHIFLIVSGDIAFSGAEVEYKYAADWFSELYTLIGDGCNAPCWIIFSPGNHDVDHSANRPMRGALLEQIRKDPALSLDDWYCSGVHQRTGFFFRLL